MFENVCLYAPFGLIVNLQLLLPPEYKNTNALLNGISLQENLKQQIKSEMYFLSN